MSPENVYKVVLEAIFNRFVHVQKVIDIFLPILVHSNWYKLTTNYTKDESNRNFNTANDCGSCPLHSVVW